jgi:hypothetical protein
LLRDESAARCVVDTGIRDNTTNEVDYNVWNRKVQQSQMEVSIINLLINYIKGKDIYMGMISLAGGPNLFLPYRSHRISEFYDYFIKYSTHVVLAI